MAQMADDVDMADFWEFMNTIFPYFQGIGEDDIINQLASQARDGYLATGDVEFLYRFIEDYFVFPPQYLDRIVDVLQTWLDDAQEEALEEQARMAEEFHNMIEEMEAGERTVPTAPSPMRSGTPSESLSVRSATPTGEGKKRHIKGGKVRLSWIDALKLWNKNNKLWTIPRKGTKEYNQVKRLMK